MKKISLFSLFVFIIISETIAQTNWNIALRAGIDAIPTSSNDNNHGGNLPKGFHIGFIGKLPVINNISFQPEAQYTWINYYSHTTVPENDFINGIAQLYQIPPEQARQLVSDYWQKTETTTSYFYFPLLMRYQYSGRLALLLGPEIGLVYRNKDVNHLTAIVSGQSVEDQTTVHGTDGIHETNIALAAGAELDISKYTALELRYVRSLNSLEDSHSSTSSYYNFVQISLLYRFFSF
ncbi:MAG TPA: porin family protein [Balneolaceae bacterium]|nr:porin family protein [Balneolaceae bacterium]